VDENKARRDALVAGSMLRSGAGRLRSRRLRGPVQDSDDADDEDCDDALRTGASGRRGVTDGRRATDRRRGRRRPAEDQADFVGRRSVSRPSECERRTEGPSARIRRSTWRSGDDCRQDVRASVAAFCGDIYDHAAVRVVRPAGRRVSIYSVFAAADLIL